MRSSRFFTRFALIALSSCTLGGITHAQAPAPGAVPPGWVWQGEWQDGRWNGQWIPGPGVPPGAFAPGAYPAPASPQWDGGSDRRRTFERCHDHHHDHDHDRDGDRRAHDHDCEELFRDRRDFRSGPPMPGPAPAYGAMPYGPGAYGGMVAPPGYMMVPVITAPQAPCVETRTVTTEYVVDKPRRVVRAQPHRKDKRVYTGS